MLYSLSCLRASIARVMPCWTSLLLPGMTLFDKLPCMRTCLVSAFSTICHLEMCDCHRCMQKITLSEALCGTSFTVTHLDGRILHVSTEPGTSYF